MNETKYTLETLFTFDSVIDLDIAYIKYFKKHLSNNVYVDKDILSSNDKEFFRSISLTRQEVDVFTLLLRKPYHDSIYSLREEIENTCYDKVLNMSEPTALYDLLYKAASTEFIKCTVLCKNEHEKLFIKPLLPHVKFIDYKSFDEQQYGAIYVKNILDISNPSKMENRTLYVLSYAFNMKDNDNNTNTIKPEYVEKFPPSSKIFLVSPYKEFKLPK